MGAARPSLEKPPCSFYPTTWQALLSVTVLGIHQDDDASLEDRVRAELRGVSGVEVERWRRLRVDCIAHTQPDQSPAALDEPRH